MSAEASKIGQIVWQDLTVPNADSIQQFYTSVVGWKAEAHDMGDYHDYEILPPASDEAVAGICYARGSNANVPAQWLIYVQVADVEASSAECINLGGKILDGPRLLGDLPFCVIQDPAGAVLALVSESVTS